MSGNEARVYEANDAAINGWMDDAIVQKIPVQEAGEQESEETHGLIRLRLCLRDRALAGSRVDKIEGASRKRGKRSLPEAGQDRPPPPRPRIVWRREDEAETRPPPAIIME